MFGKVDLSPTLSDPELFDPLTQRNANITCHPAMFGLVFTLYLVHALSGAVMDNGWDPVALVLTVLFVGGPLLWVLVRNQRDFNTRKALHPELYAPPDPLIARSRWRWTAARPGTRAYILSEIHFKNELGETIEVEYSKFVDLEWHQLGTDFQSALYSLEILMQVDTALKSRIDSLGWLPPA